MSFLRVANVFKPKQHKSSQLVSRGGIGEKNCSEESLALSDQPSEDLTDENLSSSALVDSERDHRNHFLSGQGVAQLYRDDETDRIPNCLPRPSFNRTRDEPINGEGIRPSYAEQRVEEWHAVWPVDTCNGELSEKSDPERRNWRTRFREGSQGRRVRSVQPSSINQKILPQNEENRERQPRKRDWVGIVAFHPLAIDRERQPRKRDWVSIVAFKKWVCERPIDTDKPLLQDDSPAAASENALAHSALLQIRSQNWSAAYKDAEKSIDIQPSAVGYIAKALAQTGIGDPKKAIQTFELAFSKCNFHENDLMLLIKGILLFMAGKYDEAISHVHNLITVPGNGETMHNCNQVLAKMYLLRGDCERALHSLEQALALAPSNDRCHLESISLIFGWSFEGLENAVRQRHCEALFAAGHTEEVAKALGKMLETCGGKMAASKETEKWVTDFKNKWVHSLEVFGDAAFSSGDHKKAIAKYSSALSLDPSNKIDILVKGITVLTDADEVRRIASCLTVIYQLTTPIRYAKKSIVIRSSTTSYIAKVLTQIAMGEPEKAIQTFDLAFWKCNPDESSLLLLIKAVMFFVTSKYDEAISRIYDLITIAGDDEMMYCCYQVLAKMYLMRDDSEHALHSLGRAKAFASSYNGYRLESISLIFGWTFEGLEIRVRQRYCETLHAADRTEEAAEALVRMLNNLDVEMRASKEAEEWVTDFKNKCINRLDVLGDEALGSGKHDKAIAWYTSALSLDPSKIDILVKRSKARAARGLWEDALTDADEVITLDPSSHQGYERKCIALHGMENYVEATNALLHMLSIVENSPDEKIRRLQENYITPHEAIDTIDAATREIFRLCPLVLIDLNTGRLCEAHERVHSFKSEIPFKKLVSEIAIMKQDDPHVRQTVATYFKWVMFSHTWEGKEPTFQDINLVDSVWGLDQSPLNEKLRQFCTTAHEDGHRWAWSDTCCIDKTTSAILSRSLTSMYMWYEEAAETLVYLADILDSAKLGDLTKSRWMTRAWTLQELLASKVIRFYTRGWKLYLNDTHRNHKESPAIQKELAQAMGVTPKTITNFHPGDVGVREKLRLASTRNATEEEDIAYSLIGIFSSDIIPRYGIGKTALGHLLENIVARTGDVRIIAWTGKSLPYNSALPDSLVVYRQIPHSPPPMEADELGARVEQLRAGLATREDAIAFYRKVTHLPRPTFSNRCLQLPCVLFSVMNIIRKQGDRQGTFYRSTALFLGNVEFRTADVVTPTPRKYVFVHPWLRDLRNRHDEIALDDVESDAGSDVSEAGYRSGDAPSPALYSAAHYTRALRLIVRLGRPFTALLLERQDDGRYKRVATEHEIIISGVPYQTNPRDLRARVKVLEII